MENKTVEQLAEEAFEITFDLESVPFKEYSKKELIHDIKEAIKEGIDLYREQQQPSIEPSLEEDWREKMKEAAAHSANVWVGDIAKLENYKEVEKWNEHVESFEFGNDWAWEHFIEPLAKQLQASQPIQQPSLRLPTENEIDAAANIAVEEEDWYNCPKDMFKAGVKWILEQKKEDNVPGSSNESAFLASHSSTVGNTVEQWRDPDNLGGTGHGDISYSDADSGL